MTVLLKATYADHTEISCGESCYDATNHTCRCLCLGLNHGAGLQGALTNIKQHLRWLIEEIQQRDPSVRRLQINIQLANISIVVTYSPPENNP